MSRSPVVLEINNYEIKALGVRSSFAGRSFFQPEIQLLSPDVPASVQASALILEKYPKATGVYFNAPYDALFTREITLPFLDRKKIKDILPFELESLIPHDVNDVVYDYHLYPQKGTKETRAIVTGALKESLKPYLEQFRVNNIPVLGIYAPHDALFRLAPFTQQSTAIMLHISRQISVIVVVVEGQWRFSRIIPIGYEWLIERLSQKTKKSKQEMNRILLALPASFDDADDFSLFKKNFHVTPAITKSIKEILDNFASNISLELERTLKNMGMETEENTRVNVCLSSDLNNAGILENILASAIPNPVITFPYERTPLALLNKEHIITMGGAYSQTAAGKINLLQSDLRKMVAASTGGRRRYLVIMGIIGLAAFLFSFFLDLRRKSLHLVEWEQKQLEIFQRYFNKPPSENMSLLSEARDIVSKERKKTEIFIMFFKTPKLSEMLVKLHQNIPPESGFELENFSYTSKGIEISASVPSFERLAELKKSLKKATIFTDIESRNENNMPGPGGINRIKFMLVIKVSNEEPK